MKKLLTAILLVLFLSTLIFSAALADIDGAEVVCPPPFQPHMAHDHDDHHGDHLHAGTDTDLNGDGWICVAHVTPFEIVHVHVDNNLPQ